MVALLTVTGELIHQKISHSIPFVQRMQDDLILASPSKWMVS